MSLLFTALILLFSCQKNGQTASGEASSNQPEYRLGVFLEYKDNHGLFTSETLPEVAEFWSNAAKAGQITKYTLLTKDEYVIPLEQNGYWLVPVSLNGKQKRFVFDTGCNVISLSRSTAKEFGITSIDDVHDYYLFPRELNLGFVRYEYPGTTSFAYYDNEDGIIGWTYYAGTADTLTIDMPGKQLVINGKRPEDGGIPLDETLLAAGRIVIPVEIEGHTYTAALDTGWSSDSVANSKTTHFPLIEESRLYTSLSFSWARVRGFACTYEVPELTAGSVVLRDFTFRLLDDEYTDETLEKSMTGYGIDMILGGDFFSQCRLTIDYANRLCWVEPPE